MEIQLLLLPIPIEKGIGNDYLVVVRISGIETSTAQPATNCHGKFDLRLRQRRRGFVLTDLRHNLKCRSIKPCNYSYVLFKTALVSSLNSLANNGIAGLNIFYMKILLFC